MSNSRFPLAAALAVLSLSACKNESASSGPAASSSVPPVASSAGRIDPRRALALADPGGNNPVDRVIAAYQTKVKASPVDVDALLLLGRAWIRKARETLDPGFYTDADACADLILDADPRNRLARGLKAQVKLNRHEFEQAKDLSEQILSEESSDLIALGVLSDSLLELGRYDEATAAAQRMMDIKPNLASYVRASYLRWVRGDVEGAKEPIKQAMTSGFDARDPEPQAWASVQAAMIFWHAGDYAGADAGFDRALGGFADYPPALVGKGRVAMARGDAKRAAELFGKAYFVSPLVDTAWFLGDARAALGDEAGAKEAYDLVVKRGRTSDKRTLALFLATKNRDIEEAVRLAEEEHKHRGDVSTDDALAWALYRAKRLPEARAAIDRATRLGTPDASFLFHKGAILIAQGEKQEGQKLVRAALKLNPKFDPSSVELANELAK